MPCKVDGKGRPICDITAHPNRPHDKFCATCNHRFTESYDWGILGFLIAILFAFIIVSGNQIQQGSNSRQEIKYRSYENSFLVINKRNLK